MCIVMVFGGWFPLSSFACFCLECCAAAGDEAFCGDALEDDVLDAVLTAEVSLGGAVAVFVDDEDVGTEALEVGGEVEVSAAAVDEGVVDVTDGLDHEEALGFGVCGVVVLELHDGGVAADADVEVAVFCRLTEELDVTAVEEVVATADKDFLGHGVMLRFSCSWFFARKVTFFFLFCKAKWIIIILFMRACPHIVKKCAIIYLSLVPRKSIWGLRQT